MEINRSNILKCGFKEIKSSYEEFYVIEFVEYDKELLGEIDRKLYIKKEKRKYYIKEKNWERIKTIADILDYSQNMCFNEKLGFVYLIKSDRGYKIGKSKSIHNRLNFFGVKLPFKWELINYTLIKDYHGLEKALHLKYTEKNINGEWFDLNQTDLDFINRVFRKFKFLPDFHK